MCVNVIRVSVYLRNWSHVLSFVNKATATMGEKLNKINCNEIQTLQTRMHCAYGLAELAMSRYKSAAMSFLVCSFDNCDNPDLISQHNVATYGGLCAMASFNRTELHEKVYHKSSYFWGL